VGGHSTAHVGLPNSNLFDPVAQSWAAGPNMAYARWYPTVTILPDGRALVTAGETNCDGCVAVIPEIYNPAPNSWTQLTNAPLNVPYYPHVFVLPDGRVLNTSTAEGSIVARVLDLNTQTWTVVDPLVVDGGSATMYLPGKVMKTGTSANPDASTRPSSANTYVLDMTQPLPLWRQVAPMAFPRTYHTTTSLPDGTVLVTGGGRTTDAIDASGA